MMNNAKGLIDGLDKNKNVEVKTADEFRSALASFIVHQTKKIQERDRVLDAITNEFLGKVTLHEIELPDLLQWFKAVSSSKSDYARSLLDIFRPSGPSPSPLLAPKENNDDDSSVISKMSNKDLESLQKLVSVLDKFKERTEHRTDPIENPPAGD